MSKKSKLSPEDRRASILESQMARAQEEFGPNSYIGSDADKYLTGIALKNICLRYLIDSNVLPVMKVMEIIGLPGSQKSSLAFEVMRMFGEFSAAMSYVETENKYSPVLFKSILRELFQWVAMNHPVTVEEAQHAIKIATDAIKDASKEDRDQLGVIVLDSLNGNAVEAQHARLNKEGSMGKTYAEAANLWTQFFQTYASQLLGWPILLVVTNHQKVDQANPTTGSGPYAQTNYKTPGGTGQRYAAALVLELRRPKNTKQYVSCYYEGQEVNIPNEQVGITVKVDKTSIGAGGRAINVPFIFWKDAEGQQHTFFDWHTTDAVLLNQLQAGDSEHLLRVDRKAMREICQVDCVRNRYTCPQLNLEDVDPHVLGWELTKRPDIGRELDRLIGVAQHPVFAGTMPEEILKAAGKMKKKDSSPVPTATELE